VTTFGLAPNRNTLMSN